MTRFLALVSPLTVIARPAVPTLAIRRRRPSPLPHHPMTQKTRLGITALAVMALLASFGLDWFHLRAAGLSGFSFGGSSIEPSHLMHQAGIGGLGFSVPVTAGAGNISFAGLSLDIWLIITIALVGAVLGLFATGESAPLPRFVPLIAVGVATAYIGSGFLLVGEANASLAPGLFAAAVGVACSIVTTLAPSSELAT